MKNVEKIITALTREFSGHKVEIALNFNAKIYCVFIDDIYVGNFEDRFMEKDFDNKEDKERGLKEWEEGSARNS